MAPLQPLTATSERIYVKITEPRTGTLQIRTSESAEINVAVCGSCGYVEHYINDSGRLWKYWQKGYR